jgi:hypothetical protein
MAVPDSIFASLNQVKFNWQQLVQSGDFDVCMCYHFQHLNDIGAMTTKEEQLRNRLISASIDKVLEKQETIVIVKREDLGFTQKELGPKYFHERGRDISIYVEMKDGKVVLTIQDLDCDD